MGFYKQNTVVHTIQTHFTQSRLAVAAMHGFDDGTNQEPARDKLSFSFR
jgi:hypothetical protein